MQPNRMSNSLMAAGMPRNITQPAPTPSSTADGNMPHRPAAPSATQALSGFIQKLRPSRGVRKNSKVAAAPSTGTQNVNTPPPQAAGSGNAAVSGSHRSPTPKPTN